jgi:signal peptidase I
MISCEPVRLCRFFLFLLMVRKIVIGFGILCGVLIVLLIIARITGMLLFFNIPVQANEPAMKIGDKIFVSNLIEPKPLQFIVFTSAYHDSLIAIYQSNEEPGSKFVYRLCAVAGDVIQMTNSVLYLNKKNFDNQLNIKNQFKISINYLANIDEADIAFDDPYGQFVQLGDSALITLDKMQLKKYQSQVKFIPVLSNDTLNVFQWLDKKTNWTPDNFGPLQIPANCYFVLGDNRHFAQDSRYIGFIKKEDVKGVVINR